MNINIEKDVKTHFDCLEDGTFFMTETDPYNGQLFQKRKIYENCMVGEDEAGKVEFNAIEISNTRDIGKRFVNTQIVYPMILVSVSLVVDRRDYPAPLPF